MSEAPPVDPAIAAWDGVVAERWAAYAAPGTRAAGDPAVAAVADYCASTGAPRTERELDRLLARALLATGRAAEALCVAGVSPAHPVSFHARPGAPARVLRVEALGEEGAGELSAYRALRAVVEAAAGACADGETLALSGVARLARRIEGPRAPRRRLRARCADLRRYAAAVAARAAPDTPAAREILLVTPVA
jgi:hypothetical protein